MARYIAMAVLPILLLLLGSSPAARAADEQRLELTALNLSSPKPHASCSGHRVMPPHPHNNSWVPLFRPLGPCSPSFKAAAAAAWTKLSLADVLRQDRLRVHHIHSRVSGSRGARASKGSFKEPVSLEETQIHHQAAISVVVGTERTNSEPSSIHPAATDGDGSSGLPVTVVLDTAGDVPWMRCVPCPFAQCADYDPTRSSTYAAFPCNSSACKQLGRYYNGCDGNGQCQYTVEDDKFTTSGTYSSDVLTINSVNPVRGFRFGCSHSEQGSFVNQADGIMALGRGVQSLMAQTSATYSDAFSYCLPPTATIKGFFQLGMPVGASYRFVTTPMLKDRGPPSPAATLYRVLLLAITVDGKALNVPPEVFAAGTVMDSRTIITRLPVTAYGALRAAFRNKMLYRAAPPQEDLDTCYDLTGVRYPRLPRIALVFDGNAVVEMDRSGILLNGCLAFASNYDDSSPSILGNVQQQTIQVLHDVGGGRIGFRSAAC